MTFVKTIRTLNKTLFIATTIATISCLNSIVAAQTQPFKVAYASEWAPISFGNNEKVQGILPDLIEEIIGKHMKIPVSHHGLPWARAQKSVETGLVDAFITTPTKKRLDFSIRSNSNILKVPFRAFTRTGSKAQLHLEQGQTVQNLSEFLFCDVLGNGWAKSFYEARKMNYLETSSLDNCLKMMKLNRVDIVIHASPVTQMFVRNMALENSISMLPKIYPESPNFPLLLSKKSKFGIDFLIKFDETVRVLKKTGEFDRIMEIITEKNLSSTILTQ